LAPAGNRRTIVQSLFRSVLSLILFSAAAPAADVAGVWELTYTTSTGQPREAKLTLQVDGDKLSGTLDGELGSAKIEQGRVMGNEISFTLVRTGSSDLITVTYTGTIEGNTMQLKMQYREREPTEITARRVSE
jgi:hypothetical protein